MALTKGVPPPSGLAQQGSTPLLINPAPTLIDLGKSILVQSIDPLKEPVH